MIKRDLANSLAADKGSYVQILLGPRQCGKSTLFHILNQERFQEITLDDLQLRHLADSDPALFFEQYPLPLSIDEVQYAPNLFPQIKLIVDRQKQDKLFDGRTQVLPIVRLTGSNLVLMDKCVKESLSGRASYYYMNTLTVHEIRRFNDKIAISEILFKGGWPELYVTPEQSVTKYLNDYISTYLEKEFIATIGIRKLSAFHKVLCLLAARTGTFIDYHAIANDSGVAATTIKEWVSLLERNQIVCLLKPFSNNLNKRLIKSPKIYFLDTGLAARLQGWSEITPLLNSPQAGPMFETLVFSEIHKFIQNNVKSWNLYSWRTKEKAEVDFIVEHEAGQFVALEAKLAMQSVRPIKLPGAFAKDFPNVRNVMLVTLGEHKQKLSEHCYSLPVHHLYDYLSSL